MAIESGRIAAGHSTQRGAITDIRFSLKPVDPTLQEFYYTNKDGPLVRVSTAPSFEGQMWFYRDGNNRTRVFVAVSTGVVLPVDGGNFTSGLSTATSSQVYDGGDLTAGLSAATSSQVYDGGNFTTGSTATDDDETTLDGSLAWVPTFLYAYAINTRNGLQWDPSTAS